MLLRLRTSALALLLIGCGGAATPSHSGDEGDERRPRRVVQTNLSFSLICPAGANLHGAAPPMGRRAECLNALGQPYGPSAEWDDLGELIEVKMHRAGGQLQWVLSCKGQLRTAEGSLFAAFEPERCEEVAELWFSP